MENTDELRLEEAYQAWREALTGEHKSIWSRAVTAWQDYVYYRCISTAFEAASQGSTKQQLPYGLMNTYHTAFYRSLMVELRSEIGGERDKLLKDKHGEHSLSAILNSIADTKITRAGLFRVNGMDYEYAARKALDEKEIYDALSKEGAGIIPSTHAGWRMSSDLHQRIDELTGKSEQSRSPEDIIPNKIFFDAGCTLRNHTEKLLLFVNKHIAHAATKESIELESRTVPSKIGSEDIEETFGALIGTFDMLSSDLFCWGHYSFNLDVSSKLNGVEKAFGLETGVVDLNKTYRDFTNKLDTKIKKWRPIKSPPS